MTLLYDFYLIMKPSYIWYSALLIILSLSISYYLKSLISFLAIFYMLMLIGFINGIYTLQLLVSLVMISIVILPYEKHKLSRDMRGFI